MASCPVPFLFPITVNHHQNHHAPPPNHNCTATTTIKPISFCSSSSFAINLHRSFPSKRNSWLGRCQAASSPPEPPSKKHPPPYSGVKASLARFQDTLQIFFAVLFWMSLFLWSCAWDGGDSGRRNKGSQFRK
ncbi:hypothetical protein Pfo_020071 [Paulownia fortunei]|nr:hypothetical protein Pfo_020071 [Paulownia fortunei]